MDKLKLVDESHIHLLFEWTNELERRKNSFHSKMVSFEEHKKWLRSKLEDGNCRMYIFYVLEEPVGQITLDIEEDKAYIGYSIKREARRKGYGKQIVRLAEYEILQIGLQIKYLCGKVKYDNTVSIKIFQQLNFIPSYEEEYILFTKKILHE